MTFFNVELQYVGYRYIIAIITDRNNYFGFSVNILMMLALMSHRWIISLRSSRIERIVKGTSHECTWYRRSALNSGISGFIRSISKIYREINIAVISSELQMQFGRGISFLPSYRCSPIERVNISSTSPTYYATLFVFQYRRYTRF